MQLRLMKYALFREVAHRCAPQGVAAFPQRAARARPERGNCGKA
jgi:hypothetical protein